MRSSRAEAGPPTPGCANEALEIPPSATPRSKARHWAAQRPFSGCFKPFLSVLPAISIFAPVFSTSRCRCPVGNVLTVKPNVSAWPKSAVLVRSAGRWSKGRPLGGEQQAAGKFFRLIQLRSHKSGVSSSWCYGVCLASSFRQVPGACSVVRRETAGVLERHGLLGRQHKSTVAVPNTPGPVERGRSRHPCAGHLHTTGAVCCRDAASYMQHDVLPIPFLARCLALRHPVRRL